MIRCLKAKAKNVTLVKDLKNFPRKFEAVFRTNFAPRTSSLLHKNFSTAGVLGVLSY